MTAFASTRIDGRSHVEVLLACLKGAEPGRIFTFAELSAALGIGSSRSFDKRAVCAIVATAYPRLLREHDRAVHAVRGVGYRIALASEQTGLAHQRKRRADVQLVRGLQTLQHVIWSELQPEQRRIHESMLMVMGAFWQQQKALEKRQRDVEAAVAGLSKRVDDLTPT